MIRSGFGSEDQVTRRISELERRLTLWGKAFTVATAPDAAKYKNLAAYFSNGAAGSPILAFSDGTTWRRCDTGAAISAS